MEPAVGPARAKVRFRPSILSLAKPASLKIRPVVSIPRNPWLVFLWDMRLVSNIILFFNLKSS